MIGFFIGVLQGSNVAQIMEIKTCILVGVSGKFYEFSFSFLARFQHNQLNSISIILQL
jgi:hypothetical protein